MCIVDDYVLHGFGEEMEDGKMRKRGNRRGGGGRFKGLL